LAVEFILAVYTGIKPLMLIFSEKGVPEGKPLRVKLPFAANDVVEIEELPTISIVTPLTSKPAESFTEPVKEIAYASWAPAAQNSSINTNKADKKIC